MQLSLSFSLSFSLFGFVGSHEREHPQTALRQIVVDAIAVGGFGAEIPSQPNARETLAGIVKQSMGTNELLMLEVFFIPLSTMFETNGKRIPAELMSTLVPSDSAIAAIRLGNELKTMTEHYIAAVEERLKDPDGKSTNVKLYLTQSPCHQLATIPVLSIEINALLVLMDHKFKTEDLHKGEQL
jgi:hypothetical protein